MTIVPVMTVSLADMSQWQNNINIPSTPMGEGTTQIAQLTSPANTESQSTSSINTQTRAIDLISNEAMNPMNNGAFGNMMGNVHDVISRGQLNREELALNAQEVNIDKLKSEMIPAYELKNSAITTNSSNEAIQSMAKTFDHAMFVAMVTQVASGVSNSLRMLVRQE